MVTHVCIVMVLVICLLFQRREKALPVKFSDLSRFYDFVIFIKSLCRIVQLSSSFARKFSKVRKSMANINIAYHIIINTKIATHIPVVFLIVFSI